MTAQEFDTVVAARGELERIRDALRVVWVNIDFRLGEFDGASTARPMAEVIAVGRARDHLMRAIRELEAAQKGKTSCLKT